MGPEFWAAIAGAAVGGVFTIVGGFVQQKWSQKRDDHRQLVYTRKEITRSLLRTKRDERHFEEYLVDVPFAFGDDPAIMKQLDEYEAAVKKFGYSAGNVKHIRWGFIGSLAEAAEVPKEYVERRR